MESRIKNGSRNIVAGFVNQIVQIIIPFIVRTVFIKVLGEKYLGLSSLFSSILTVLNLSELGFGSALIFSMYKPVAENDIEKIGALLKIYRRVYNYIGCSILAVGSFLSLFLPKLISGEIPQDINIYVVYFIFLINTSISYFAFAYKKALLKAYQRNDIISNINTFTTLATNSIQLLSLIIVKNYYVYACIYPMFTLIDNLIANHLANKAFPDIKCKGDISNNEKQEIKKHVIGIAIQKFCSASRNSFDNIAISMFMGLSTIAIYGNYYLIMNSVHSLLYQIPNAIRSTVGNSIASTSIDKNYNDFNTFTLVYSWIAGWCTVCLLCLYQPFMRMWMGDNLLFPFTTVGLLAFYFYDLCMSDIISLYKDGAGLWWLGKIRTLSEAIVNLLLNFLLGWLLGINGIILASILTLTFIGHGYGGYIIFTGYFKGKRFSAYILKQLWYLVGTMTISIISVFLCSHILIDNFTGFLIKGVFCLIVPNIMFFAFFRVDKYFPNAVALLKNILFSAKRKKKQ